MTGNTYAKARAVFLAVLMVVSVVGMTMGLAGSAAADVTTSDFASDTTVQGGEEVTITSTVGNGTEDVLVYVDLNDSGTFDSGEEFTRVDATDLELEDGTDTFEVNITAPAESEVESPDSTQVYVEQEDPLSEGDDYDNADDNVGGLTIDDTAPDINVTGEQTPADGAIVNDPEQTITVPVSDELTGVDYITVDVDNNGEINSYEINPDSEENDGISYEESEVTIDPGASEEVQSFEDGQVDVTVTATDTAGNQGTSSFGFEVDTTSIGAEYDAPGAVSAFDNPEAEAGAVTNDVNQTVVATLIPSDSDIDDSTAGLEITGPDEDSETFDYTDDVYDNESNEFTVDPGADEDIAAFDTDGQYDAQLTGESEAGNQLDETFPLEVDTEPIAVDDISRTDNLTGTVNNPIASWNSEYIEIDFNDTVAEDSVAVEVTVNGETVEDPLHPPEDGNREIFYPNDGNYDTVRAYLDLNQDAFQGVTDDEVEINVTAAQDLPGNSLANADAEASNTTFAIDTDAPSVELGELPNDGELSGYVNMSSFVANSDDVDSYEFNVNLGENPQDRSTHTIGDYEAAESVDTTQFPDGPHQLQVVVEDENGNTDEAVASFSLDNRNNRVITVEPYFLAGHSHDDFDDVEPSLVGQDLDLSENVFDSLDDENTTYRVAGDETAEFNVENYSSGDIVTLEADFDYTDETETVDVEVIRLPDVGVETYDEGGQEDDDPSTIEVTSGMDLSTLNATVESADDYDDAEVTLTRSDFTESGDRYVADVPELRDGSWNVQVDEFGTDLQASDNDATTSFTLDNEDPVLTDATISGADDDGRTQLALEFNEPVSVPDPTALDVEGDTQAIGGSTDGSDGTVVVQLDDVLQTGDDTEVTYAAGSVDEQVGDDSNDETSAVVDTVDLELSAGNNLVSVPAATGRLDVSELDTSNVNAIWAYDDGWQKHIPGEDDNEFDVLVGGQGYVVNMETADEIPVRVYNTPGATGSEAPAVPASEDIENGWNLVGHFQEADQPRDEALSTISDSYSADKVLGESGDGSYQAVSTLEPGEGYWLFAEGEDVYAEQPFTDAPAIFNLDALDVEGEETYDNLDAENEENVLVQASVDDPDGVDTVTFDSSEDETTAEMTDDNGDGVYTAEVTLDLTEESGNTTIGTVTATDDAGESGTVDLDAFVNEEGDLAISGGSTTDDYANATTTETTEVTFTATDVSADGDTDTFTLDVDEQLDGDYLSDNINDVSTNVGVEGSPTAVETDDDGEVDAIRFDVAPDGGGTVDVTATVSVDLQYPSGETTYSFDAQVDDSDGDSASSSEGVASIDGDERPALSDATTADSNDDGTLEEISLTFSEGVDNVDASDYTLSEGAISSITHAGGSATATIDLDTETPLDTGATPTVTYQSDDDGTETVDADQQGLEVTDGDDVVANDGASPVLTDIGNFNAGNDEVDVTFSESVQNIQNTDLEANVNDGGFQEVSAVNSSSGTTITVTVSQGFTSDDDVTVQTASDTNIEDSIGNTAVTESSDTGTAPAM